VISAASPHFQGIDLTQITADIEISPHDQQGDAMPNPIGYVRGLGRTVVGNRTIPAIVGTPGDDHLVGDQISPGNDDLMFGRAGNDLIEGLLGNDVIRGGRGDDVLRGGPGNDTIRGGRGDDTISGGDGDDTLLGGAGNDTLDDAAGNNRLDGGAGDDVLRSGFRSVDGLATETEVIGGEGRDQLILVVPDSAEPFAGMSVRMDGGAGDDIIRVDPGRTGIITLAPAGDDPDQPIILGRIYNAGAGNDTVLPLYHYRVVVVDEAGATPSRIEIQDQMSVDLGAGDDTLDNRLVVSFDSNLERVNKIEAFTWKAKVTVDGGSGNDLIQERFELDTRPAGGNEIRVETLTIAHEGFDHAGAGHDDIRLDDELVIDPGSATTTALAFTRTVLGEAGDDQVLDTSRLIVEAGEPGRVLIGHEVAHVVQQGNDRVEDRATFQIALSGENDLASISRLIGGGDGNDSLLLTGSYDIAVGGGSSRAGGAALMLSLTLDGGDGDDLLAFNPKEFAIDKPLESSAAVSAQIALLAGSGRDTIAFDTDALLAGRSEGWVAPEILIDGGAGFDALEFRGSARVEIDLDAGVAIIDPGEDAILVHLRQIERASAFDLMI
jgi:Ca2+-binding RTX toxin-like protein